IIATPLGDNERGTAILLDLEYDPTRRTGMGQPLGAWQARMACGVLRDGLEVPRTPDRPPWRGEGPEVPAPRERGDDLRGGPRDGVDPVLAAQRVPHPRLREDVEVPRELRHDPRDPEGLGRRGRPAVPAEGTLSEGLRVRRGLFQDHEGGARRDARRDCDREGRPRGG